MSKHYPSYPPSQDRGAGIQQRPASFLLNRIPATAMAALGPGRSPRAFDRGPSAVDSGRNQPAGSSGRGQIPGIRRPNELSSDRSRNQPSRDPGQSGFPGAGVRNDFPDLPGTHEQNQFPLAHGLNDFPAPPGAHSWNQLHGAPAQGQIPGIHGPNELPGGPGQNEFPRAGASRDGKPFSFPCSAAGLARVPAFSVGAVVCCLFGRGWVLLRGALGSVAARPDEAARKTAVFGLKCLLALLIAGSVWLLAVMAVLPDGGAR